ncbi:hypothetical protein ACHWQZ_G004177 [Mnemiopsis leidyi]
MSSPDSEKIRQRNIAKGALLEEADADCKKLIGVYKPTETYKKNHSVMSHSIYTSAVIKKCLNYMEVETHRGANKDKIFKNKRDLGVTLTPDYRWSTHINQMAAGARRLASWALGVFRDRSSVVMLTLWKPLIRCTLEHCCPLRQPHKLEDVRALEDVQRFFNRHILGMKDADYWGRVSKPKLQSLRDRSSVVMLTLWKPLIRCTLEHCCPLRQPHKLEDVRALEDVQRFFNRHILGMKDADYWGRVSKPKLQSLQRRREH